MYLQSCAEHPGRDARLFVVGGRVEGAIERIAPPGEWRRTSRAARARFRSRRSRIEALAVQAAAALGLDWAGVDAVRRAQGRPCSR